MQYEIMLVLFVPKQDRKKEIITVKTQKSLIWMYDNKNMAYFISLTIQWKSTCEGENIYTKM